MRRYIFLSPIFLSRILPRGKWTTGKYLFVYNILSNFQSLTLRPHAYLKKITFSADFPSAIIDRPM